MRDVIVVIGAGSIGQAIARRVAAGKIVLLADICQESAEAAAKTLNDAGFDVETVTVDVSARASVHALVEAGTPDEVGAVGALLMGPDGAFITGSDILMDGGVTAAYWFGELAPQ